MSTDMVAHPRGKWLLPETGEIVDQFGFLKQMAKKQVVLLGEFHDVAEIHRWQLHTASYLHAYRPDMMIGFEMFPVRVQPVLDRWVAGELKTQAFLKAVDWTHIWGFPPEIYLPLFHFCRQQSVRMLALNCYRELVTRVGKGGWDTIPEAERDGLTPSAPPLAGHQAYLESLMRRDNDSSERSLVSERFMRAQQTWDRAFACNIVSALNASKNKDGTCPLVIGIIGKGHLEYGFGTPYQLADLGVSDTAVLLPTDRATHFLSTIQGIGDGIFRLDDVEPRVERNCV